MTVSELPKTTTLDAVFRCQLTSFSITPHSIAELRAPNYNPAPHQYVPAQHAPPESDSSSTFHPSTYRTLTLKFWRHTTQNHLLPDPLHFENVFNNLPPCSLSCACSSIIFPRLLPPPASPPLLRILLLLLLLAPALLLFIPLPYSSLPPLFRSF